MRRGRAVGQSEPALGLFRPARQRTYPGSIDGERGIPRQLVVAEPPEPFIQRLHSAVVMERQRHDVEQAGNGVRLAGFVTVDDRFLRHVVRDAPGHGASVECGNDIRLGAFELVPEQFAEQVVVAIPLAAPVEGDDEAVRALELLEPLYRAGGLEHGVAEAPGHAIEH